MVLAAGGVVRGRAPPRGLSPFQVTDGFVAEYCDTQGRSGPEVLNCKSGSGHFVAFNGGQKMSELYRQLDKAFHPASIAVVGVSSRLDNPGTLALRSIMGMGFEGPLYPVNPKYDEILGLACYPSVRDAPVTPELVLLAIPPGAVPAAVAECAEAGVRACVVNAAGFSETGRPGAAGLEADILGTLKNSDLRLIGPNCMGIYSSSGKVALFDGQQPGAGRVSLVSQSGSLASFMYLLGAERAISFSKMVSSGNELDLNCADFLDYFSRDPETELVIAYLEQVRDARRFLDIARDLKGRKPLLVWKAGLSGSGGRAATSHTGAMAGSADVWQAAVKQAGIVEVFDLADTMDTAAAFYHLARPAGRRLAVISPPGGIAVNCADFAERYGLELPALGGEAAERLSAILPGEGTSVANPVDMGFGAVVPGNLASVIEVVASDPGVDILMVVAGAPASRKGDPGLVRMHTAELKEASALIEKPLVVIGVPTGLAFPYMAELFWEGVPCYLTPRAACGALSRLLDYHGL